MADSKISKKIKNARLAVQRAVQEGRDELYIQKKEIELEKLLTDKQFRQIRRR